MMIPRSNSSSGDLATWDPDANAMVRVIRVISTRVYVGGDFTSVGGQTRNRIAALDPSTGLAYSNFNPGANGAVYALATLNNILLCGGTFTTLGGQTRNRIAAIDAYWASPTYGDVTAWDPDANATVRALRTTGSNIYVGGDFTTIGGVARNRIAAFDSAPGPVTSWDPSAENSVYALVVAGSKVYAGGTFKIINGKERHNIAELDSTGVATSWNPNASDIVYGLAVSGDNSTVYAGGQFTSIGGAPRNMLAALSTTTGLATDWDPNPDSAVLGVAVSPDGSTVYAAGYFSLSIGGALRHYLAALNAATGNATAWDPNANSTVTGLVLSGDGLTVYARGYFTTIDGQARNGLAALSSTTGHATAWNPNPDNTVSALSVLGTTVYAGGSFSSIGGQTRKGIAALNGTTGLATPWDPNPKMVFMDPSIMTLAASGGTVYVSGLFTEIGGQTRTCLAGIDAATGLATAWNPPSTALVGCLGMAASGSTVAVGGFYEDIAGEWRPNFARFEAVAAPSNPATTAIGLNTITWTWQDNSSDETGFKVYDDPGSGAPVTLRTTTAANVEFWQHNGLAANSQYAFQVAATNALGDSMPTRKLVEWTLIQAVSGFTFSNVTPNSITVASANTPSNLSSGASGLYFANDTAGTNSGWKQNMTPWTSAALTPNTPYFFMGLSRNGAGLYTATKFATKCTLAATPLAPVLSNPTEHSLDVAIAAGDGNPSPTPYALRILPPIQGNVWVQANGSIGTNPVYRTAAAWATTTVTGLAEYTLYAFVAIARNVEGIETAVGPLSVMMTTDNTPPTVTMSSFVPDPTNMNPIPVMVVFSEVVTGFTVTDIVAGNGTVGDFADLGGRIYTFNLTPLATGLVTADIAADVATDVAGQGNEKAPQFSRTLAAPTIMLQPAGGSAYVGDSFSFMAAASGGVAPLNYQWRLNGSDIGGATNITLVRGPLVLGDTGSYTCVVTNSGGVGSATSQTATLNVAEHLAITTQPMSQTWPEGWPHVTFVVKVSGGIGPISYQWRRDGMDLTGGDQSTYTIPFLQVDHQGTYTGLVTDEFNDEEVVSDAAILTVLTGIPVPATSGLALAALLSTCLLAGGAILRRKK